STGLKVANIANTSSPSLSNFILDTNGTPFPALGVALHRITDGKNWLLVASGDLGLKIIDLSNLGAPVVRATLDTPGSAKDVDVSSDGRYAYVADFGGGLHIFDITAITSPTLVGTFARPNDGPATAVAAMTTLTSPPKKLALTAWGFSSPHIKVIDVTIPTQPIQLSTLPVLAEVDTFGNYAVVPASSFGLLFYDLANPAVPAERYRVATPGSAQSVHVVGDKAYVGDFAAAVDVVDILSDN
ncbi:MAG: hypothetical protein AAB468_02075, partial [Patescibacteria group bacterium]